MEIVMHKSQTSREQLFVYQAQHEVKGQSQKPSNIQYFSFPKLKRLTIKGETKAAACNDKCIYPGWNVHPHLSKHDSHSILNGHVATEVPGIPL